ncbi:MAG: hypothetical protein ABIJ16_09445 [Bacteroidota bacterium]
MNKYLLISPTGKRLVCRTYNDADRLQKKLAVKGIKTTMQVTMKG